ncbi:uncharacterized protein LOC111011861 [Momordica charantia]|uniref:Uncharacterized protein LOC111011861 n=1 Tax=Momordica charantia TaxID=3673 RepID=A0A6J1CJZ0_MOMCH|nr:uncharacterized protein LOC111011861 [Momordica charantia]
MDYFSGERDLFGKLRIIVSSFFGFLLCASTFWSPMQTHKRRPVPESVRFSISGLKALISSEEGEEGEEKAQRLIRSAGVGIIRSKLLTHSSSSSSIRSCLLMDDLIGTESGVCLTNSIAEEIDEKSSDYRYHRVDHRDLDKQNQRCAAEKQFPPPISFLAAQAGPRTRPPWVLTRHCSDGRLTLTLERVRHLQYMESHRENGRLILKFVPAPLPDDSEDDDRDLQFVEEDGGREKRTEDAEDIESIECEEGEAIEEASDPAFKSFTYGGEGIGGGMFRDRQPFCSVDRHVVNGHFGSAPLRPMGTVT